jgi:hypothetical protein
MIAFLAKGYRSRAKGTTGAETGLGVSDRIVGKLIPKRIPPLSCFSVFSFKLSVEEP